MAINFTRLFTTLGLNCGALNETNTYRGTTLVTRRNTLQTQLVTAMSVYGPYVSGLTTDLESAQDAENTYVGSLGTLALNALTAEVVADRPLTDTSKSAVLAELRRQMLIAGESLNDCPGTVTVADVGSPTGDHQFVFGIKEASTGLTTDFLVPDVYLIECTADRSNSGSAFAETFSLVGKPADALPTDATYPSGTGLSTTVTAVDPASDGGVVTNGGFDTWTATNTPTGWTIASGVAGTQVFQKGSDDPRGTAADNKSMRLLGASSTLVKVRQEVTVTPLTSYTAHFRLKKIADPGTDWGVSMRLVDGNGTAIAGPGSYANLIASATAGSVAGDWTNVVKGQFVTPSTLPTTGVWVEIVFHQFTDITVAPADTSEVYVDHVALIATEPLYDGGPTLTCFSGTTEGVLGDTRTATVALTSGVPSTYLIRGIDRLVGLASDASRIPTVAGGGETQSDSLVT